ncbi:MAG: stage IV sporulation protein A, partial [Firmicutes bacterium]|nr:stage IV sporulation protein A [Bacillota bacterium]
MENLFRDISERTGGDIYIGVVGGVRTGKSTFIKRFMELLVIPNIPNIYDRERARDELPQAGTGKTVTTTEPKFVPAEAVEIVLDPGVKLRVRLVDCVGYRVAGALGYDEEDVPRLVTTPWFEEPIPFEEAAEVGTRKVIQDHSTIGIVMTTDGTITNLPRESYVEAEERVIQELKDLDKPFVVILNSTRPHALETVQLVEELTKRYDVPVLAIDVLQMSESDVYNVLGEVLYEFPVSEVNITLPPWVDELGSEHWLHQEFETAVRDAVKKVRRVRDIQGVTATLKEQHFIGDVILQETNLGTGTASIKLTAAEGLFYKILSEITGYTLSELIGQTPHVFSSGRHDRAFYEKMWKSLTETGFWRGEIWNQRKDGRLYLEEIAISAVK